MILKVSQLLSISYRGHVGELILRKWTFSDSLIEVVKESRNFSYSHEGGANLVDLVQFALVQGGYAGDGICPDNTLEIPAFGKLGIDPDVNIIEIEDNQEKIEQTRQSLMF